MTWSTNGTSNPRAATSVANSTHFGELLKLATAKSKKGKDKIKGQAPTDQDFLGVVFAPFANGAARL
jgi:hypothetical protein